MNSEKTGAQKMENEINDLIEAIKANYAKFKGVTPIETKLVEEFNSRIEVTTGKKFIKIITNRSVWGFIALYDDDKFRRGDILKAASWNAPAKNFARGNILDGGYKVHWTGA